MTTEEYCREIEAHLCRKNDGHLIRIVGPSFERVCGWATQGIPLRIACHGIDRYFVRYYAKGQRRRPVHIDFCENDVMDAFDAWRRAVGVRLPGGGADEAVQVAQRKKSLPDHLDRVCERLTARRTAMPPLAAVDAVLDMIATEAAVFRDQPRPVRGEARERVAARLVELDRAMIDAARAHADPSLLLRMRAEATDQLRPFRDRMTAEAYERAIESAVDRLLREHEKLPTVSFG